MDDILLNIDSKYRDINHYSNETKFRINFDNNFKNIFSIQVASVELNHNVQFFNYQNIYSRKGNNYLILHIPNKLNDIDGTKIIITDGYTRSIDALKKNINDQLTFFNSHFNTNEKYFYIFYLVNDVPALNLTIGWYSLYGLYNIIKTSKILINFQLNIYDRRYPSSYRTDNINLFGTNINNLKNNLYTIYINDVINFIPNILGSGILDIIFATFSSFYSITSSAIFNIKFDYDSDSFITYFSNTLISSTLTPPTLIPSIEEIIPFDIDFYNISLLQNYKLNYPSLGYFLGFRPNKNENNFILSSSFDNKISSSNLFSNYPYNINDNLYLFLKIEDWGNIQFLDKKFMSKVIFTSHCNSNKVDDLVSPEYKFRQPINFQKLDIELLDYLGNAIDLNGRDFSFTIKIKQILNTEEKSKIERTNLYFLNN